MIKQYVHQFWIANGIVLCGLATISPTQAQIASDGTLSTNVKTTDNLNFTISDGNRAGSNLFHSFSEFSVPTRGSALFNNAPDIQNIISRVTGSSLSYIDGLIKANSSANLFLLNPNGIIFGPNASLNIGGSFLGSTASSLKFADGTFSATADPTTPLLTVSVPLGLQFGGTAGSIRTQSQASNDSSRRVGLQVQPGKTLALVGGDVELAGGYLTAAEGRIELGSVAGNGLVSLNPTNKGWALGYEGVQNFKDIRIFQQAVVNASGKGGGDIQVQGGSVTLTDRSFISANTLGSQNGGGAFIRALQLNIEGGSLVSTNTIGSGRGGNVTIETGKLSVRDGTQITAITLGEGLGGNLTVTASEIIELSGTSSGLFVTTLGAKAAGNVTIATGKLSVSNGAKVVSNTVGEGSGGDLTVTASEVELSGTSSGLFASSLSAGAAGDVTIKTRQLNVRDGAQVTNGTFSTGSGGNLSVTASEVELSGISISADGTFPSGLLASSLGAGDAGDVIITTEKLSIRKGARISTGTSGGGSGGDLTVTAYDTVELIGTSPDGNFLSSLFASSLGAEAAGNVTITTEKLSIRDGAEVAVSNEGSGNAGNLNVVARSILLDNSGKLTAETASGKGGDINLQVQDLLLLRHKSQISTTAGTAGSGGDGGNITINSTPFIVAVPTENSDIKANAFLGQGGKVTINAQSIFGLAERNLEDIQALLGDEDPIQLNPINLASSDITAISQTDPSLRGQVTINTPDVDPSQGLVALPQEVVDVVGLIAQSCPAGGGNVGRQSEFIVTGRGGLPPNPSETLSSDTVWTDLRPRTGQAENGFSTAVATSPNASSTGQLVEAQGWVINNLGEVVLTATAPFGWLTAKPTVTPHIPWMTPATCHTLETSSF